MNTKPKARSSRWADERGTAVWVVPFVGVLVLTALALAFQGGLLVAQRRVQAAADLAALAGAGALQRGDDGCDAASRMAARNGASMDRCRVDDRDVVVTLARAGPLLWGRSAEVRAMARAGPAQTP
jgi:secretion/DNA translocation related TadE-like protein